MSTEIEEAHRRETESLFDYALRNDLTVYRMIREGWPHKAIIGQLAIEKRERLKRIMELESIAPKKIRTRDGREFVHHCPNELVPVTNPEQH